MTLTYTTEAYTTFTGGDYVEEVADYAGALGATGLKNFVLRFVDPNGTLLIADEWRGYDTLAGIMNVARINHKHRYADGHTHTNTIESFWALVKRAHYGTHHHYSRKYMPLYIAEACYKYNIRNKPGKETFTEALAMLVA